MNEETKQTIISDITEICANAQDFDLIKEQALRNWGRKEPLPYRFIEVLQDAVLEWFYNNFDEYEFV